jgi:hypothetical protein
MVICCELGRTGEEAEVFEETTAVQFLAPLGSL